MSKLVTATFKTRPAAETAMRELEAINITDEQISVVVTDETHGKSFNIDEGNKSGEGVATGATVGGIIGGIVGALSTATAMAVPGLNIVVAGALVSTLAGIGAGATAGGFVGGLVGMGIPEHEAKIYEEEIKNGGILVAVEAKDSDQKDQIKDIFERQDAHSLAA